MATNQRKVKETLLRACFNHVLSFQIVAVIELMYDCTTWILINHLGKKLDGNYTRMLSTLFNTSRKQHPTKQILFDHLPPIMWANQIKWTKYAGHCKKLKRNSLPTFSYELLYKDTPMLDDMQNLILISSVWILGVI